jgi:hypothetical protein
MRAFYQIHIFSRFNFVAALKEEGDCIVCLEMRGNELMRRLIFSELTNYRVVRTSPELLQIWVVR